MNNRRQKIRPFTTFTLILILQLSLICSTIRAQSPISFNIVWNASEINGRIEVTGGKLIKIEPSQRNRHGNTFQIAANSPARITVHVSDVRIDPGPEPTRITVHTSKNAFSFLLRDLNKDYPIFIPNYGVAVLTSDDSRSYTDVEKEILLRKTITKIQQIEKDKEVSFDLVAPHNRHMSVPIWLGVSRDMRMFDISEELQDAGQEGKIIRPKYSSSLIKLNETNANAAYIYALGRGVGVKNNITRRLENGFLPIYHSELRDDDVLYHSITFVSFANQPLTNTTNRGTHYIVADKHSSGRTFKDEHLKELEEKMKTAYDFEDDMVLYSQTTIENKGAVPRYAWIKTPRPGTGWWYRKIHEYDHDTGFSSFANGKVFCISKLNGKPLPNEEMAILLRPGEKVKFTFYMPHTPISPEKASAISNQSFSKRYDEARAYWQNKLNSTAQITLPEKRIEEMLKAGLLHLDLVTFGQEPDGVLSANIGVYSPIGTESSPIIQYYLSMGRFNEAKRALNYFLETQLKSGYIQNYEGYTVETGAALWSMGEYMRYTDDVSWLKDSEYKILKSVDYLLQWRNKNKKEELKGRGYGMIDGKVADPEDHFHQFMLNGYAYLGLSRIAEVLGKVNPGIASQIRKEAEAWKNDILETVRTLWALSPVVPLGDGRWVPTLPPWAEADGPRNLFQKKETFWSHGTFTGADAMLGPLYLIFCEVINPHSSEAKMMLDYHSELFYQGNAAFSQPYYSRHNWLQAKLGMVKPFLNTYYNTFSAHADRETYTFWEHMYRVSPHKTHEEAWFLMESRWMLYMEDGDTLSLLKTIPRAWMNNGNEIMLNGVKSYFGEIKLSTKSHLSEGYIEAFIECTSIRKPEIVTIRLPHPENRRPTKVYGGTYNEATETLIISGFSGKANVKIEF